MNGEVGEGVEGEGGEGEGVRDDEDEPHYQRAPISAGGEAGTTIEGGWSILACHLYCVLRDISYCTHNYDIPIYCTTTSMICVYMRY